MITAIDTNVRSTLWAGEDASVEASLLLRQAKALGSLVVCGIAYAECLANPLLTEREIDRFLAEAEMQIEFGLGEEVWRESGRRYAKYARRRKRSLGSEPRRVAADFLIGSHALLMTDRLLTFDTGHYKSSFPELTLVGQTIY